MPLWLWIMLGAGGVYLLTKAGSSAASSASTSGGTPDWSGDNLPTAQSSVPADMQTGQSISLPAGTKLFSDSKLTQTAGSVTNAQSVTVSQTGVGADGSVSGSFNNNGKTVWFAQPGT